MVHSPYPVAGVTEAEAEAEAEADEEALPPLKALASLVA
jgi:hypothetical protein